MEFEIKHGELNHKEELLQLYKKVAAIPDDIIRNEHEITEEYIAGFIANSLSKGVILVATFNGAIVGEIHAYTPNIYAFQHILSDLTIVVNPAFQGKGIGRGLFERFLNIVMKDLQHIKRIELYTREYNKRNIQFYESLGFKNEGRQQNKIFVSECAFETPIHMAWLKPE